MTGSSRRLVAAVGARMMRTTLKSCECRRRGVFDGVAVFAAAPVATFLTLLLELLLSFGIGKSKAKLDAIVLDWEGVKLSDDTLSSLTMFESDKVS